MNKGLLAGLITGAIIACLVYGAPERTKNESGGVIREKSQAVKELKQSPEWLSLQADLDGLTEKIALYDTNYIAATNAIAGTTGATKAALNKLLNVMEDDHKVDVATKRCLVDLKKIIVDVVDAQ